MKGAFKATVAWMLGDDVAADDVFRIRRTNTQQGRFLLHAFRRLETLDVSCSVKTDSKEIADKIMSNVNAETDFDGKFSEQLKVEMKERDIAAVTLDAVSASMPVKMTVRPI